MMDPKASTSHQYCDPSGTDPGPPRKKQDIGLNGWIETVCCEELSTIRPGVHKAVRFENSEDQLWILEALKNLIGNTQKLELGKVFFRKILILYKGFKAALKDLLSDIDNASSKILLIHGVPKVGKTCLAMSLAYYLSLYGQSATYVKLKNDGYLDNEVTLNTWAKYMFIEPSRWTIFDQVNLNCITNKEFDFIDHVINASKHKVYMPIIMFTSGHHAPGGFWTHNMHVKYKVIDLSVDESVVEDLKKELEVLDQQIAVQNEVVLEVSTIFGHVEECIGYCSTQEPHTVVEFEDLKNVVYQNLDHDNLENHLNIFWLLWPNFYQLKPEEIVNQDPKDWQIEPVIVQFLNLFLLDDYDPPDTPHNPILNWLNISGEPADNSSPDDGYCSFSNNYFYYLPIFNKLCDILKASYDACTPKKMYKTYIDLCDKLVTVGVANAKVLRGHIFENIVKLKCEMETDEIDRKGVQISFTDVADIVDVNEVYKTSDEDKLIAKAVAVFKDSKPCVVWCILNAAGGGCFQEYVFACIKTEGKSESNIVQLMQATINPRNHSTDTMDKFKEKMEKACTAFDAQVTGHFLVPRGVTMKKSKMDRFPVATFEF